MPERSERASVCEVRSGHRGTAGSRKDTKEIILKSLEIQGIAEVIFIERCFYEMIFKRKSFHIFRNVGNESIREDELNDIQNAYSDFTPLNPEIKTAIRIVPEEETNCKRGGEYVTNEQMNDKKFLKLIKAMEE